MGMVVAIVAVIVLACLAAAWWSDRRDRPGSHRHRRPSEIRAAGTDARRNSRWRRAQLDHDMFPARKLDDGDDRST